MSHPLTEHSKIMGVPTIRIKVGDYELFDWKDDKHIGISHVSGDAGLFQKKEFEAHVAAFFGLNFS